MRWGTGTGVRTAGVGSSAGGGVGGALRRYHRAVSGAQQRRQVWFRLHRPHPDLWGEGDVQQVTLDREVLGRLAEGLRISSTAGEDAAPVAAVAPPPRPTTTLERSYTGLASLLRPATTCLVGVPEDVADRMPWAAAGCGMTAARLDGRPPGTRIGRDGESLNVGPPPGWMIGTDDYGAPVTLHLPPGSTVVLRGETAAGVAATVAPSGRVVGQDVSIISAGSGGVPAWREAWHPQRCRIVVGTAGNGSDGTDGTDGVLADVTVDLDAGTVADATGTTVTRFTPLPLRL